MEFNNIAITIKFPLFKCKMWPAKARSCAHICEATGTVTPCDKYAESQSRSVCCAVTVVKRLLPNFVKYAEAQSRSDCYPAPTRRSR